MVLGYLLERKFLVRRIAIYIRDEEYGFIIHGIICDNKLFNTLNDLFRTDVVHRYTVFCCNIPWVVVWAVAFLYPLTQLSIFAITHFDFSLILLQIVFQQLPYFSGDAFSEFHDGFLLDQAA